MEEGTKAIGQDLRVETPEVCLVEDTAAARAGLGEDARRMIEALPTFEFAS